MREVSQRNRLADPEDRDWLSAADVISLCSRHAVHLTMVCFVEKRNTFRPAGERTQQRA